MQGILVQSMIWENPMCRGATRPVHKHRPQATTTEACGATAHAPQQEKTLQEKTPQLERRPLSLLRKDPAKQQRPSVAKIKISKLINFLKVYK